MSEKPLCELLGDKHTYRYENAGYTCIYCGKTVEYDIMNRDFK